MYCFFIYYKVYKEQGKAEQFFTRPSWFDLLMGTSTVRQQIIAGKTEATIRQGWQDGLIRYKKIRDMYLLYP